MCRKMEMSHGSDVRKPIETSSWCALQDPQHVLRTQCVPQISAAQCVVEYTKHRKLVGVITDGDMCDGW